MRDMCLMGGANCWMLTSLELKSFNKMVSHQTKIRLISLKDHFSFFKILYSIIILIKAKNKNPSNPYFEDPFAKLTSLSPGNIKSSSIIIQHRRHTISRHAMTWRSMEKENHALNCLIVISSVLVLAWGDILRSIMSKPQLSQGCGLNLF